MVRSDGAPVRPEALSAMASAISFWGPDGHGQWRGEVAGLGHLMLHVTPESLNERLPASIRTAPHLVITADARIDNRDELFDALGVPSAGRGQTPDSSLILLAYERWGPGCVGRLLGDFAFAIWNIRDRTLFCARDPFGCRPFVYHHDAHRFVFASDIRGVLPAVAAPALNEPLLAAYLQMKTYHAEKRYTFFRDIVKLPPAHTLTVTQEHVRLAQYWSGDDAPELRLSTDRDYEEQMRILFEDAVRCRLRSAFPVGSHLSGGLDSSSVTVMAARTLRERGQQLTTYSWSPAPEAGGSDPLSEYARIEAVCRTEDLTCEFIPATTRSVIESLQRDIAIEPAEMLTREAAVQSRAAMCGLRVMLSGWGGDEGVSLRARDFLPELLRRRGWREFTRMAASQVRNAQSQRPLRSVAGIATTVVLPQLPDRLYCLVNSRAQMRYEAPCIHPDFQREYHTAAKELAGPLWRHLPAMRATIQRRFEVGHIAKRAEHWATSGTRHGIEYRYPMLDRRLVEFILGVPPERHRDLASATPLFARVASGFLPPEVTGSHRKEEHQTIAALRNEHLAAHRQWGEHLLLLSQREIPCSRFVDRGMLQRVIREGIREHRMAVFSGARAAFLVMAIRE